jgi:hypothetical protein
MTTDERIARLERAVAQVGGVLIAAALGASKWRLPHADLDELITEYGVPRPMTDVTMLPPDLFERRGGI